MEPELDFESRMSVLDTSLYERVDSQTSDNDRRSLLALQNAVRIRFSSYVYLEIGSYRGGSIQPHLLDPRCRRIYSIDKRSPDKVPDVRGFGVFYTNSTRQMLDSLEQLAPDQMNKITCFDEDAGDIPASLLVDRPQLCFIDGEHTDRAVYADFQFCLSLCDSDAVIVFHDSDLIYRGIAAAARYLRGRGIRFDAVALPDTVYCLGLNGSRAIHDEAVKQMAEDGLVFLSNRLDDPL